VLGKLVYPVPKFNPLIPSDKTLSNVRFLTATLLGTPISGLPSIFEAATIKIPLVVAGVVPEINAGKARKLPGM
jgi:hypothetical protein